MELSIKPFETFEEGRTIMNELSSTQAMITSLINNDSDQSKTEAINELKNIVEKNEQFLVKLENHDGDITVSV